jgi:hypothetical protein
LSYRERRVFPGGCFFSAVAAEFDTHAGLVRDRIVAMEESFIALLTADIDRAKELGRLSSMEENAATSIRAPRLPGDGKHVIRPL